MDARRYLDHWYLRDRDSIDLPLQASLESKLRGSYLKIFRLLFACAAFVSFVRAQQVTAPAQPATGPGGSTYYFGKIQSFGPYSVPGTTGAAFRYVIYQPTQPSGTKSLPVVLFLHGHLAQLEGSYALGDSPANYIDWIYQLCTNGFTVVFPVYDAGLPYQQFPATILTDWGSALALLASGKGGLIPRSVDAQGPQTACIGHSFGAYECLAVSQLISLVRPTGMPLLRALLPFTIGISNDNVTTDFSNLDPSTYVVMVKGDLDTTNNDIGVSDTIYASLQNTIPAAQRDYLMVVTDTHGSPAQLGDHFFVMTNGFGDNAAVDDRDYNVSWKLSVGLLDCVFRGLYCDYGLGHGSYNQINMGTWSDGVPVTPLQWISSVPGTAIQQ